MLRKSFFFAVILLALASCHSSGTKASSPTFELSGALSGGGEGIKVYLDRILPDTTMHLDSSVIDKDGKFVFHTAGIYKGFYLLRITEANFATLILDSTEKIHIEGNAQFLGNTYSVDGSPDSKLFWEMNQQSKLYGMRSDSVQHLAVALINQYKGNKKKVDSLSDRFERVNDSLFDKQVTFVEQFIKKHTNSFACLAGVQQLDAKTHLSYFVMLDSALYKQYPTSVYAKLLHERVTVMKRLAIGASAPDFTMSDTSGKNIALSSFKGKLVLINFWGSWCKPCAETMPTLAKLYDKYKSKDFTILGVAIDKEKTQWIEAIQKLKMTWPQVSDLQFGDSPVLQLYNFRKPPYNVLVSADGKILDKNVDEATLDHTIDSLTRKH